MTARMGDGNTSRVLIWIDDTVIVRKPGNGKTIYVRGGRRVRNAGFPGEPGVLRPGGWNTTASPTSRRSSPPTLPRRPTPTESRLADPKLMDGNYQWLTTVRTADGRFAHQGFSRIWYGERADAEYNETTESARDHRPAGLPSGAAGQVQVLDRPGQVRQGRQVPVRRETRSSSAFRIQQGRRSRSWSLAADEFGGVLDEPRSSGGRQLGQYGITLEKPNRYGGSVSFRVEEYKKPEFEVTVDAPDRAGRCSARRSRPRSQAKYYFGRPVVEGTVKYKVELLAAQRAVVSRPAVGLVLRSRRTGGSPASAKWYPGFGRLGLALRRSRSGSAGIPNRRSLSPNRKSRSGRTERSKSRSTPPWRRNSTGTRTTPTRSRPKWWTTRAASSSAPETCWSPASRSRSSRGSDRGHYRAGSTVKAEFQAQTVEREAGRRSGKLLLAQDHATTPTAFRRRDDRGVERSTPNAEGHAAQQDQGGAAGTVSAVLQGDRRRAAHDRRGYLFVVAGDGFDGNEFSLSTTSS